MDSQTACSLASLAAIHAGVKVCWVYNPKEYKLVILNNFSHNIYTHRYMSMHLKEKCTLSNFSSLVVQIVCKHPPSSINPS